MNAATALSGFIPVSLKPLQSHRSSHHYYADVFGVAYGFYHREDRDAFVDYVSSVCKLDGYKVGGHGKLSQYRFVVVCWSCGYALWLYRQFMDALVYSRR